MKLSKKVLSVLLALVMIISMATVAFARTAADVLDGSETLTWTLKAQVMAGTGVSESVALDVENTVPSSVKSAQIKAQRADVATYKESIGDLEYYDAGNTDPIIVNPGDMVWITTHIEASDSLYVGTLSQDWYYDSNMFMTVAMSMAQAAYVNKDSQVMMFADGSVTGSPWGRLHPDYRTAWVQNADGLTDAQKASHHLYHMTVVYDSATMEDEYGGELYEAIDEDLYAVPVYVRADAKPGSTGTILMTNNGLLVCDDGEGDWTDTMFAIPQDGHIVDNQVLTFKVAGGEEAELDYEELKAQIADYEGRNADAYTTDTWAAATTAYNAAKALVDAAESQDDINTAATNLKNALAALEAKPVLDYTGINNAIAAVPADLSSYTTTTANAVATAKANAESVKASATTQAELNNAATALNNAVAALDAKANFANLDAALSEATAITNTGYTADSWDALQKAIAAGNAFNRDETGISAQAQVNTAANNIYDAIDGLEKEVVLDYTAWSNAVANIPADLSGYTPASVSAYNAAKDAAYVAYDVAVAGKDQAALNAAAADLQAAIDSLVAVANKTALQAAIAQTPEYDADMYSNWDAYASALATANNVNADANATQNAVDAATTALNNAFAALVVAAADYSAVEDAKDSVPADLSGYTAESAKAVEDAVAAVVYGKDKTEQAAVNAMAKAIEDAVAALEALANYEAVEAAKKDAAALNADLYVSVADVEAAVAAVVYGLGETKQAEVDAMAKAITDAIAALEEKAADYSKVEAAKKAASEVNRDLYTAASLADLDDAVAAVVEGKKISDQAEVDAMAQAITDAIAALKFKPTEGAVQETTSTNKPFAANTFSIKVNGRPNKIRFVDVNNTALTVTFSREAARAAGKIVSYNAADEVVSDLSREIAYEIWTVEVAFNPGTYYVNVKDNYGWEDLALSYIYEYKYSADDKAVESITAGVESATVGEFVPVTVVTGADVVKVQVVVNGMAIATYNNGVVDAEGNVTYEVMAKIYAVGDNTISVNVKTANGWEAADASVVVTGVAAE